MPSKSCSQTTLTLHAVCRGPLSDPLLDLLVRTAESVIVCSPATPESTPLPSLSVFARELVRRPLPLTPSVVLLATSYLSRTKQKLPPTARGLPCTVHRIMLAALLVASKYLHDGPIRNRSWAAYSGLFSLAELNLMERQLLFLVDYELATEPEALELLVVANPDVVDMESGRIARSTVVKPLAVPVPISKSARVKIAHLSSDKKEASVPIITKNYPTPPLDASSASTTTVTTTTTVSTTSAGEGVAAQAAERSTSSCSTCVATASVVKKSTTRPTLSIKTSLSTTSVIRYHEPPTPPEPTRRGPPPPPPGPPARIRKSVSIAPPKRSNTSSSSSSSSSGNTLDAATIEAVRHTITAAAAASRRQIAKMAAAAAIARRSMARPQPVC